MLHHTRMVAAIVFGRAVTWGAARRRTTSAARARWSTESAHTALGLALVALASLLPLEQALWLAPVLVPLALSALTSLLLGSARLGRTLERAGLFLVPSETQPDPLVMRAEELRALTEGDSSGRFRDVVLDAVLVAAHIERLSGSVQVASVDPDLRERALRVGPAGLSESERRTLLSDPSSLRWLHREAWRAWPTETWELSRHAPQLPNVS
jgi:membrane glycosyltransferase